MAQLFLRRFLNFSSLLLLMLTGANACLANDASNIVENPAKYTDKSLSVGETFKSFFANYQRQIKQTWKHQKGIRKNRRVSCTFDVEDGGVVKNIQVIRKSGSLEFDDAVVKAIERTHVKSLPEQWTDQLGVFVAFDSKPNFKVKLSAVRKSKLLKKSDSSEPQVSLDRLVISPNQVSPAAQSAYESAAHYPKIFAKLFPYCDEPKQSHQSLLDCFTSNFGEKTPLCWVEANFVDEVCRLGWGLPKIQEAVDERFGSSFHNADNPAYEKYLSVRLWKQSSKKHITAYEQWKELKRSQPKAEYRQNSIEVQLGSRDPHYDWGPYSADLERRFKRQWFPRQSPAGNASRRIEVAFKIHQDGSLSGVRLIASSKSDDDDKRALDAAKNASPCKRLLPDTESIDVHVVFTQNN
jgi:TonB family protein